MGPLAIRLEALLYRDGYGVQEAIELLHSLGDPLPADAELRRLAARIPARTRPRTVDSAAAAEISTEDATDSELLRNELNQARAITSQEIERALQSLDPEDHIVLKMHYFDGVTVADIARTLQVDQRRLYGRIDSCKKRLRSLLEQRGVDREMVAAFLTD